ncbi:MAG: cell division protein FtsA [Parcubacteria group bacterium Gr01-1014_18]|nr:MAG: cell division protein FtsA [Parcubacteria group bacterium Greene0416_36]TSC81294.1 MAG: cell division protein FtsA [Parcubacteria group bacterium Gr01-1014_18]TSC99316.1 MAG: cell division protein FtsA [Parcubacteria group bacterium Greene1014_20]TSD06847.1 MAG: cell division protein FtsA [Parcubacteria group bacterium Greene0714_2]
MSRDEIITGIDVGSRSVRVVVGQRIPEREKGSALQVIGVSECPSEGISKGVIKSIEDAVSSISLCLEKAERMAGVPIEHSYISISGAHVISQTSKGVIAVSKADGEIHEEDVDRVIEAAQAVATPPNYEILHVIPKFFTIDSQSGIKDPIGMTGVRLEVEAQIILGLSSQIKNLTKAIYRTGVDIDDLVLGSLAGSESVLTKRQKELGVGLLNMGGATTALVVFEEGEVLHSAVLAVGSDHITADIAIGLRTSFDVAEQIKILYGCALPEEIDKDEKISLKEFTQEDVNYSRRQIASIIEARLEEIYEMVDRELRKINRSGLLPAGIVLSGGGAKLKGSLEVAKRKFRLPATIGYPELATSIEKLNDPAYAVAVGLVLWGNRVADSSGGGKSTFRFSAVEGVKEKIKDWIRSLIP